MNHTGGKMKRKIIIKGLLLVLCILLSSATNVQSQTLCEDDYCIDYTYGAILSSGTAGESFDKGCKDFKSGNYREAFMHYTEDSTCETQLMGVCYVLGLVAGTTCSVLSQNLLSFPVCMLAFDGMCWLATISMCETTGYNYNVINLNNDYYHYNNHLCETTNHNLNCITNYTRYYRGTG